MAPKAWKGGSGVDICLLLACWELGQSQHVRGGSWVPGNAAADHGKWGLRPRVAETGNAPSESVLRSLAQADSPSADKGGIPQPEVKVCPQTG